MIARQYVGAVQRVPKLTPEPPYVDVEFAPLFSFDMTYLNLRTGLTLDHFKRKTLEALGPKVVTVGVKGIIFSNITQMDYLFVSDGGYAKRKRSVTPQCLCSSSVGFTHISLRRASHPCLINTSAGSCRGTAAYFHNRQFYNAYKCRIQKYFAHFRYARTFGPNK
eukprot:1187777-Prorocentrum_minimum.AAC.3